MSGTYQRKYGVATVTATHITIPIVKAGANDFAVAADWTPAAGDVKVTKDNGTPANIGTLPAYTANLGWVFTFSASELSCKQLTVLIVDSATKAIEDQFFSIETFGHASAMFKQDISASVWDEVASSHTTAGTFGEYFYRMMSGVGTRVKMFLAQLNIVATGNDDAISAAGSGTGAGMKNTGGATGDGQKNIGGASSGSGTFNQGQNGIGLNNQGSSIAQQNYGSNIGVYNWGHGATGNGMQNLGGGYGIRNLANNSGPGMSNEGATNGAGMVNTGAGTGKDLSAPDNDLGITSAPTVEQIRTEMDANSTKLNDILVDTGTTIPAQITAEHSILDSAIGVVDSKVDTIEAKTSLMTFTGSNIDANIKAKDAAVGLTAQEKLDVNLEADTSLTDYDSGNGVAKESSVLSIQNNTRFVSSIPSYYLIPSAGNNVYQLTANFYDSAGNMEDPDSNDVGLDLDTADGTDKNALLYKDSAATIALDASGIAGHLKLERTDVGRYFCFVKIASTETESQFMYNFALIEAGLSLFYSRSNNVLSEDPGTTTLADNATNKDIIAEALKERDVSLTGAVSGSIYSDINDNIDATETKVDTIDSVVDAILVDTADMQPRVNAIEVDTGTTIPNQISGLNDISLAGVNAEVDTALSDINLDHLLKVAVSPSEVTPGSVIAEMTGKYGDYGTFDYTTDSLEALGIKTGDIKAVTDNIPDGGSLSTINGNINDIETLLGTVDGKVDIVDSNVDIIISKLPSGSISEFSFSSVTDGMTFGYISQLVAAMVNGRYVIDPVSGNMTIYQRDNATVLTVIKTTTNNRTRVS
jgi:hypothetical protein